MSKPSNRLSAFRSYSYYHVLAMCDCSVTADSLSEEMSDEVWAHARLDTHNSDSRPGLTNLGRFAPKQLKSGGKYCILINGSTDATFDIKSATWSTVTASVAVPNDKGTSITVEGKLEILEPKGIVFLDQLVKCSIALGVDSSQVVYVLKTFFVGHMDDFGASQLFDIDTHISDVPPVTFLAYDISGVFTETGGVYEMSFVGIGHGAARLPQFSKCVNAMNFTGGRSLYETIKKLQDNINASYNNYFNCVYDQIKAINSPNTAKILQSLRPVVYQIELAKDYQDSKYIVVDQPGQYKNNSGCTDPASVNFPAHTSIESAISQIMQMSPQIQDEMGTGDKADRVKYEFKIHTAVVSTNKGSVEQPLMEYKVYYRVERFMTPKTIAFDSAFQVLAGDHAEQELSKADSLLSERLRELKHNIIEFDYIYTGKNIDILEFDMKVNLGLAYLQTATLANTFKSQIEHTPNKLTQSSNGDVESLGVTKGDVAVQVPVFFGTQVKDPSLFNTQTASSSIQSAYTLSKHSSLEVSEVTMKIVGNELLLGSTSKTSSAKVITENSQGDVIDEQAADFAHWGKLPAYAKVRIKMPRENDDFSLLTGESNDENTDYAREFWFDGYYYVYGIDHSFQDGEFTQTLQLLGIPKRSAFETSQSAPKSVSLNDSIGSCYDNKIGYTPPNSKQSSPTGSGSNQSNVAVGETPPQGTTSATNRADAKAINKRATSPDQVVGWKNASTDVKSAILNASGKGIDAAVMAQIAAKESALGRNLKNPYSSATGLYQFIDETWLGLVKQGKIPGLKPSMPQQQLLDARFDPQMNAYAGAAYLTDNARAIGSDDPGDLYLAHFLGPGGREAAGARQIISADNGTGGQAKLIAILGPDRFAKIKAANPSIIKSDQMTVGELRTWAATEMANQVLNGAPPVVGQSNKTPLSPAGASSAPTTGKSEPSGSTQDTQRKASQAVAVQQNQAAQQAKSNIKPCGTLADRPQNGDQYQ